MQSKELYELRPDETTSDKKEKMYLSKKGKKCIDKLLKKLPPKTSLVAVTGIQISPQALYNYINYDKPLSKRGVLACTALFDYFIVVEIEDEEIKGITLDVALKVVKKHGGIVTF